MCVCSIGADIHSEILCLFLSFAICRVYERDSCMYTASLTIYTTRFKTRNGSSPENDSLFALRDEMETLFRRWDINIGESRVVGRLGLMMFEFQPLHLLSLKYTITRLTDYRFNRGRELEDVQERNERRAHPTGAQPGAASAAAGPFLPRAP